jgi:cell division protein FtsQ
MWDNPRLLNLTANVLVGAALAAAVLGAGAAMVRSSAFPLKTIRVTGELEHVTRAQVVSALEERVSGTFFTVDLDAIRGFFEGIPWVRRADVRRQWPDGLEVRLEEHVALAWWARERDGRLVNTYGELFSGQGDAALPLLAGPTGSAAEVASRYAELRKQLVPLGLELKAVLLSQRYAWQLHLSNGLTVQLGRDREKDRVVDRFARFVAAYPHTLAKLERRLNYVDLRYPNGFALRVPEAPVPHSRRLPRA